MSQKTILIVDDEERDRNWLKSLLAGGVADGHDVQPRE